MKHKVNVWFNVVKNNDMKSIFIFETFQTSGEKYLKSKSVFSYFKLCNNIRQK